ncbi:DUF4832 domain-containing protein [Candidatus Latescibacterota bacterium]
MRKTNFFVLIIIVLVFSTEMCCAQNRVVVRPEDNGKALVNPMMGWVLHYYDNSPKNYGSRLEPSNTLDEFPGLAVIYLRIAWSYLEPEEGKFTWSLLDTPSQRWIDKGLRVALRLTCSETGIRYATPEWVMKAGAKGYYFSRGKVDENGSNWEPAFDDPIFLVKLNNFLTAAAARYDGNPNVDFIDVGTFGAWGEGHTIATTRLRYPPETIMTHIDMHTKLFRNTLLVAVDDFSFLDTDFNDLSREDNRHNKNPQTSKSIDYAANKGLTLRDDSILVQGPPWEYFSAEMAQKFWPNHPVILESEHYGSSKRSDAWGDGSAYLRAVEEYHASYASIHWWPDEFMNEQIDLINKINIRLGYRLNLKECMWSDTITLSDSLVIESQWANVGVAPCYPGGYMAITLKDEQGGIVAVLTDETFNVQSLSVGPPGEPPVRTLISTFRWAMNMKKGTFSLFVSVGQRDGTPSIALPYPDNDGHKRYRLGTITLE